MLKQTMILNKIMLSSLNKTSIYIIFTKLNTQTSGKTIILLENIKPEKAYQTFKERYPKWGCMRAPGF